MGTNYYARLGPMETHIGKSSAGWCFGLHVYPEHGINTLEDWLEFLRQHPDISIISEYDRTHSVEELTQIITKRSWGDGHTSTIDHILNHSESGPNGLARHRIEDGSCIGHGEGTYDYMVGEFC